MNENKKIEPTDEMVNKAANALSLDATGMSMRHQEYWDARAYRNKARLALHSALNHPDAAGLFEENHTDCAHVDEAARRVEAAREQGWDGAAEWVKDEFPGIQWAANALNAANPYRLTRVEHVRLPEKYPAHITDVEVSDGEVCDYMALDHSGDWCGVSQAGRFCDWRAWGILACTQGEYRLTRDGCFEDGTPRFRKEGRA